MTGRQWHTCFAFREQMQGMGITSLDAPDLGWAKLTSDDVAPYFWTA